MLSRKRLIQLINTHELSDVWRTFHHNCRQYTWTHVRDNIVSLARLDRIYCYSHQSNVFRSCNIFPVSFSDHCMVHCAVFLNFVKPQSAYWHFNNALLNDKDFKDILEFFWKDFRDSKSTFSSLQQWWDYGKAQIKQLSQQYTKNITANLDRSMKVLEMEIVQLQEQLETNGQWNVMRDISEKKSKLNDFLETKAKGALIRSRFLNVDQMDVPSKFFFGLEKKNGQKRFFHSLRSDSGRMLTDVNEIRKRIVSFYKELYKCELKDEQNIRNSFFKELPQVSIESNGDISGELRLEELEKALQSMALGKAPGIDGLTVEFFKAFWSVVGEDLLEVLNDSFTNGHLPLSCRRAVLTLLPKKGDLTEIKCWRPVSVLCSDYKILSKALANRLSGVLEQVIQSDQSYCIPERSIFDNISFIRDIFDLSKMKGFDVGLISLDQEKAFDRVEHQYLLKTLEAFGFTKEFVGKIKILYNDIESILKVNGGLCAPFKVERGVRQGCPLSGMLYSIAIEPLLCKVRENIKGVSLPFSGKTVSLSAYADDVVVLISDQKDIDTVVNILNDFKKISSAKVNWAKSEAILVGNWSQGIPKLPHDLSWSTGGFKYLGVFLGDASTVKKNWDDAFEKVKGRLNKWKWLIPKMSYRGRTLIINNLAASTLWHRLACVDPPLSLL